MLRQAPVASESLLELPRLREMFSERGRQRSVEEAPDAKPRALVLDDNPETLAKVGSILRRQGLEVLTAATVDEAKDVFSKDLALIVSDLDVSEGFFDLKGRIGGYRFLDWALKRGYEGVAMLHSTAFDNPALSLMLSPLRRDLERRGVHLQGKKATFASEEGDRPMDAAESLGLAMQEAGRRIDGGLRV